MVCSYDIGMYGVYVCKLIQFGHIIANIDEVSLYVTSLKTSFLSHLYKVL